MPSCLSFAKTSASILEGGGAREGEGKALAARGASVATTSARRITERRMGISQPTQARESPAAVARHDGDRFDLDEEILAAEPRLDARTRRKRIEAEPVEEGRADLVEVLVIALDVAQVAGRAHDVVPGRALRGEQLGNVAVGAPELRAEVADMCRASSLVHARRPGD